MTAVAFDTYEAANRFKAAGFTEPQVDALVEVARMTTALPDISTLATKDDLIPLKSDISSLRTDLARVEAVLRAEVKTEISGVKALIASTQVQTIAIVLTGTAAMLTLSRLFH